MKHSLQYFLKFRKSAFCQSVVMLAVFACMFAFAMFQGGFTGWFIFYAFLPFVLYMIFLVIYPFRLIEAERTIQEKELSAGDTMHVRIVLKRKWPAPFFLVTIQEEFAPLSGGPIREGKTGMLFWMRRHAVFSYSVADMARGKYTVREIQLKTGDPFGFFHRTVRLKCEATWLVFPKVQPLEIPGAGPGRITPDGRQRDLSRFAGIRPYQPTDRLSWLDWKSTARTNQLVAKQFEPERERHASVVFVARRKDTDALFERGVAFTASLVRTLLEAGFTVLLTWSGTEKPLLLRGSVVRATAGANEKLAELSEAEALKADDLRLSGDSRKAGFVVTTDPALAQPVSEFARSARQRQTLFFVTDYGAEDSLKPCKSPYFSLYLLINEQFDRLFKAGG
ncbi:DUF58 domain-containing protein [Sporolactobacillus putidus]|uniref:DUF58 domain-containing protein n=1 Tax=Sporolactobacillus putidus TaxID=492735 RepID=A0A917RZ10_9BACL|nr:DUF58 domain-containing protein [Sporolactobacillus putidus]GGL43160.1 hypothetical protein GCM10007968_03840 [Sporolactobacillus putidus]